MKQEVTAKLNVHFSNNRQDWATPWELFNKVEARYGPFTMDVCASKSNAKCVCFYDMAADGLSAFNPWRGVCWMNPPYGRNIGQWVKKAVMSVLGGTASKVVALLPARTDTAWWHDWVVPYGQVEFIRGRIKFEGANFNAPFPSAIVVFDSDKGAL